MSNNRPKWQRARVVLDDEFPEFVGREFWVRIGKPVMTTAETPQGFITTFPCVTGNLLGFRGVPVATPIQCIELLGRGPEDFADDVPLVKWGDWLAQKDI